jgi:ribonuclease HII
MGSSRFKFERELVQRGLRLIAGVDEAGRGPLAGPVVAAAVIFPCEWIRDGLPRRFWGLNDSKQLLAEDRDHYFRLLTSDDRVRFGVSIVDVDIIDAINILQASLRAMNLALDQLNPIPEHSLVDGNQICTLRHPQTALVDGDARSYSVAAASVIAKVTRDRLMHDYDRQFPGYGFAEHKGYGTPQHLAALAAQGPCPLHRKSFYPIRQPEPELFQL